MSWLVFTVVLCSLTSSSTLIHSVSFVWFPLAPHSAHSFTVLTVKEGNYWKSTHPTFSLVSHLLLTHSSSLTVLVQMREKTNQNRWGRVVGMRGGTKGREKWTPCQVQWFCVFVDWFTQIRSFWLTLLDWFHWLVLRVTHMSSYECDWEVSWSKLVLMNDWHWLVRLVLMNWVRIGLVLMKSDVNRLVLVLRLVLR